MAWKKVHLGRHMPATVLLTAMIFHPAAGAQNEGMDPRLLVTARQFSPMGVTTDDSGIPQVACVIPVSVTRPGAYAVILAGYNVDASESLPSGRLTFRLIRRGPQGDFSADPKPVEVDMPDDAHGCALRWVDLGKGNRAILVSSEWSKTTTFSSLLQWDGNNFEKLFDGLTGVELLDLDEDGVPEVLYSENTPPPAGPAEKRLLKWMDGLYLKPILFDYSVIGPRELETCSNPAAPCEATSKEIELHTFPSRGLGQFVLKIRNGWNDQHPRMVTARILLNDKLVAGPEDVHPGVGFVVRPISLVVPSTLSVECNGPEGAVMYLWIEEQPRSVPPGR